jgi:hypothetical protein
MLEAKLSYRSGLRKENDLTKYLSYEEAIKRYAAKKCREKSVIEMCLEVH